MPSRWKRLVALTAWAALVGCAREAVTGPDVSAVKAATRNHYQLVYTASVAGDPSLTDLFFLDTRSGIVTQLTTHAGRDQMPSWSPGGDRIVFSTTAFSAGNDAADLDLAIMDVAADGSPGQIVRITAGNGAETYPAWSPMGDKIVYVCDLSPWPMPHNPHLCYSQWDGSVWQGPTPLTMDPPPFIPDPNIKQTRVRDMHPTWSPDGNWVLFSRTCIVQGAWPPPPGPGCLFGDRELFLLRFPVPGVPGTGTTMRVTETPSIYEDNPSWQPASGSRKIVYNALGYYMKGPVEFESEDIYSATMPDSVALAASERLTGMGTQLTATGENDYPWWTPEADEILFLSWRDGTWDLFRMLPDGSHQRNLTATLTLDEGFGRIRPVPVTP